jgi:hypothetical protein
MDGSNYKGWDRHVGRHVQSQCAEEIAQEKPVEVAKIIAGELKDPWVGGEIEQLRYTNEKLVPLVSKLVALLHKNGLVTKQELYDITQIFRFFDG